MRKCLGTFVEWGLTVVLRVLDLKSLVLVTPDSTSRDIDQILVAPVVQVAQVMVVILVVCRVAVPIMDIPETKELALSAELFVMKLSA
jgi:hypothetical protein